MPIDLQEEADGRILTVRVSEKLTRQDYEDFVPEVERYITQHGRIRMLLDMAEFRGWTLGAMWDDMRFGLKHLNDFERLALVGNQAWERAVAVVWRPFTRAVIRYFDRAAAEEARAWIGLAAGQRDG